MPPKGKKTKAEEALDFLSNLDNLDEPTVTEPVEPRVSTDSVKRSTESSATEARSSTPVVPAEDEEAQKALDFLEAQIKTKRAPLSAPRPRPATPTHPPAIGPGAGLGERSATPNRPTAPVSSGWGIGSLWSTATSAVQSAQKIADEQYKKVAAEGYGGGLAGVDLDKLRKGAEERLGGLQGYVKGVDLEKLRQDLLNTTSSTLTNILNTVAPPISAHETLELWLSHPMVGYAGVETVVYRAWQNILEQTESGQLVIVWSPERDGQDKDEDRAINPVEGWEEGWKRQEAELGSVKNREGGVKDKPDTPVTKIPIFLHLQPILAPLNIPEPPVLFKDETKATPPKHLYFLFTLHDPTHSLRFSTTTQPSPADWLDVEYDKSDWVEERLVEVLRTGVEIIAQDYVATRMGLKPSSGSVSPIDAEVKETNDVKKD